MKAIIYSLIGCLFLNSCGSRSRDNELIGQIKKVMKNTPIICPDYNDVDVSLGIIRNGVGSMSSEDVWLYVPNSEDFKKLVEANESGKLVKIKYDDKRVTFCVENKHVTSVEFLE